MKRFQAQIITRIVEAQKIYSQAEACGILEEFKKIHEETILDHQEAFRRALFEAKK